MARYEHLPIYKAALDLTVHLEKVVAGFSRYHKYTLGTELRERSRAVLQQVVRANNQAHREDRAAALLHLRDDIEALLLALRVAKEVKAFKSFAAYLHTVEQAGGVARQNEGWFKHTAAALGACGGGFGSRRAVTQ
jgi:23S rRNA-intervening sequence protein